MDLTISIGTSRYPCKRLWKASSEKISSALSKFRYTFWSYTKLDIATEFVKIDDEYYRPMKTAQFNREGGFWETVLEKVVGNDGTKNETPELAEPEW